MYILEYYENYWVQIFEHKVVTFTHYVTSVSLTFHILFYCILSSGYTRDLEVIPESPNAVLITQ